MQARTGLPRNLEGIPRASSLDRSGVPPRSRARASDRSRANEQASIETQKIRGRKTSQNYDTDSTSVKIAFSSSQRLAQNRQPLAKGDVSVRFSCPRRPAPTEEGRGERTREEAYGSAGHHGGPHRIPGPAVTIPHALTWADHARLKSAHISREREEGAHNHLFSGPRCGPGGRPGPSAVSGAGWWRASGGEVRCAMPRRGGAHPTEPAHRRATAKDTRGRRLSGNHRRCRSTHSFLIPRHGPPCRKAGLLATAALDVPNSGSDHRRVYRPPPRPCGSGQP